jgi:hypothetical protein
MRALLLQAFYSIRSCRARRAFCTDLGMLGVRGRNQAFVSLLRQAVADHQCPEGAFPAVPARQRRGLTFLNKQTPNSSALTWRSVTRRPDDNLLV